MYGFIKRLKWLKWTAEKVYPYKTVKMVKMDVKKVCLYKMVKMDIRICMTL